MKAKDKNKKHLKITLKSLITFLATIVIILYCVIFYNYYLASNKVYAVEEVSSNPSNVKISNARKIDIEKILEENAKEGQREEYVVEEAELEYITTYRNNSKLPKGQLQVVQEGREGKQQITIKKTYQDDELISEEQV